MRGRFTPLTATMLASLASLSLLAACSETSSVTALRSPGEAQFTIGTTPNAAGSVATHFSSSGTTQYCSSGAVAGDFTVPASYPAITSGCGTASDLQAALAVYNPGWDANITGSSWIGPNASSADYKMAPGRYVFQTTFTVPAGVTNIVLNDTLMSDNAVAVYVNGHLLESQTIADCTVALQCNWNTTKRFVISDANQADFVVGTNYITVLLVDTPNGGNSGNSYACTKRPQNWGSHGFSNDNTSPTQPNHVYAGYDTTTTTLAQYVAAGCLNPTGLDFSGQVSWVVPPPPSTTWCSPGFWKNAGFDLWTQYHNTLYSSIGSWRAPLGNKAPTSGPGSNPTLAQVVQNPQIYGGPATNSVADFLSNKAFGTPIGSGVESCPDAGSITVH